MGGELQGRVRVTPRCRPASERHKVPQGVGGHGEDRRLAAGLTSAYVHHHAAEDRTAVRAQSRVGKPRSWRHFVETVIAMVVGMAVLGMPFRAALGSFGYTRDEAFRSPRVDRRDGGAAGPRDRLPDAVGVLRGVRRRGQRRLPRDRQGRERPPVRAVRVRGPGRRAVFGLPNWFMWRGADPARAQLIERRTL